MSCLVDTHGTRCQCGTAADPPPVPTAEPETVSEGARCACGKRASVRVRLREHGGRIVIVEPCPSHYDETLKRGTVLGQAAIVGEK